MIHSFVSLENRWKEFVGVRSDENTMFDLCSDTESAKTIKRLLDVVDSLSARLRTGGLRSRESTSAVQALHKQIIQLESEVDSLHDSLAAPSKLHIKVKGMLTLGVRDALAGQVVRNGVSFAQAYAAVITPLRCIYPNLAFIGHIEHHKAQAQAAISSVAMQGRLVKHVLAWECARVVSGDGGADSGVGKEWRRAQRIVEADVDTSVSGGGAFSQDSTTGAGDAADSAETALARANLPSKDAQSGRKGGFMALAFDGIYMYVYVCMLARIFSSVHISNPRRTQVIMNACIYVLLYKLRNWHMVGTQLCFNGAHVQTRDGHAV